MGVVYEAADDPLGRTVALKLISPRLAADPDFRERFRGEAQALAALDSPHVVHVYAYGEAGGRLYLATQLVPDGDLGVWLRDQGAPTVDVALDLMAQVAGGLADAHDAGLVHRDVKPANVLLRRRDAGLTAYLGDFGIARRLDRGTTDDGPGTGTPAYMAPELHAGHPADARTDIYALGCLLWATLTGRAPYPGTTDDQVIRANLEQPVPRLPGRSARTREVNRILRTAMAKDPAQRYSSARELREDLRRAGSLPDRPARLLGAVAALVLVALTTLASQGLPGGDPEVTAGSHPDSPAERTDAERAAASFARTLLDQVVVVDRAQATCAARAWIDDIGLARLVAAGYFTEDLEYVDLEIRRVPPRIRQSLGAATRSCLGR